MKFPTHWSKATATGADREGARQSVSCWRWSNVSQEDAQRSAQDAAERLMTRRLRGEQLRAYQYGQRPLREEVLETLTDGKGQTIAAVTRNAYGVLVLNTARVMFIDRDEVSVPLAGRLKSLLARWTGGAGNAPADAEEAELRQHLENFLREHPDWGLRLYRTGAGFRMLATHGLFDPQSDSTRQLMQTLQADPLYIRLCHDQACFRARLTPKPWRCGHVPNRVSWPFEDEEQRQRFDRWLVEYVRLQGDFATCRYLGSLGTPHIDAQIEPVIEIHDKLTRADESLPLA